MRDRQREATFGKVAQGAMWAAGEDSAPVARVSGLEVEQRWAIAHAAHHCTLGIGGGVLSAIRWLTEFDRVYWQVAVGVAEAGLKGVARVVQDAEALKARLRRYGEPGLEKDINAARFTASLIGLAANAVVRDPRQLAGQVLGRCGAEPRPQFVQALWEGASKWVDRATASRASGGGGLRVLVPDRHSGLELGGGNLCKVLEGCSGWKIAVTPDGKKVVTGSSNNTACVWDLESGVALVKLEGHSKWVNAVAVTPDGKKVVTGSFDKTARVWDLESGVELVKLEGHSEGVVTSWPA